MTQNLPDTTELLEEFVNNLIREKKFPTENPVVLEEIKADLMERVEVFLNAGLLALLPETEMERFDQLLAGENDEPLQSFMKQHIPNLQDRVADILLDFKAVYLNS